MSEGVEERVFELEMAMSVAHDRLKECEAEIADLKALLELQRKTNQITNRGAGTDVGVHQEFDWARAELMRKQEKEDWRWGAGPWWDVGEGWRVHVGLDKHFCWCFNRRSGEVTDWTSLRLELYGETPEGFERLVRDAIAAGRRGGAGPGVELDLEL